MEVVEQSHPHLGADGQWTILKPVAGEAESGPHIVEDAVRSCKTLNRMKRDALRGIEYAQVHFLDRFAPFVAHTAPRLRNRNSTGERSGERCGMDGLFED